MSLYTAETAIHPSERSGASKEAREIGKRVEELEQRENRKAKMTTSTLFERIDSAVFDAPIEKIKEAHEHYNKLETTAPAFLTGEVISE